MKKINIAKEFLKFTSSSELTREECSFCGFSELQRLVKCMAVDDLDITLLEDACKMLSEHYMVEVPPYKASTVDISGYHICTCCTGSIKKKKFQSIPLYSYANACWRGDTPKELQGLTLFEEQCIALARATRCTFKLKPGPTGQTASSGNVCILPQDPRMLPLVLPLPMSELFDEVAVVLLRKKDQEITIKVCTSYLAYYVITLLRASADFLPYSESKLSPTSCPPWSCFGSSPMAD